LSGPLENERCKQRNQKKQKIFENCAGTAKLCCNNQIQIVLTLGNFLNGGTPKGGAFGFKLNALSKLGETKSVDNKSSLVHYLIKLFQSPKYRKEDLINFADELPHVKSATASMCKVMFV
jgi:hypothetical protein